MHRCRGAANSLLGVFGGCSPGASPATADAGALSGRVVTLGQQILEGGAPVIVSELPQ